VHGRRDHADLARQPQLALQARGQPGAARGHADQLERARAHRDQALDAAQQLGVERFGI
jgi:hypothetical protein